MVCRLESFMDCDDKIATHGFEIGELAVATP